ncbi:MAG: hypothetical protein ABI607_00575 [Betaproteobacteria bacterium]
MIKLWEEFEVPHRRDEGVRLRAPSKGIYWQLQDGLIVRVAAGDALQDAAEAQRALLALAVRDAEAQ